MNVECLTLPQEIPEWRRSGRFVLLATALHLAILFYPLKIALGLSETPPRTVFVHLAEPALPTPEPIQAPPEKPKPQPAPPQPVKKKIPRPVLAIAPQPNGRHPYRQQLLNQSPPSRPRRHVQPTRAHPHRSSHRALMPPISKTRTPNTPRHHGVWVRRVKFCSGYALAPTACRLRSTWKKAVILNAWMKQPGKSLHAGASYPPNAASKPSKRQSSYRSSLGWRAELPIKYGHFFRLTAARAASVRAPSHR